MLPLKQSERAKASVPPGTHLQTPTVAVIGDDANVGRIGAGADERVQVVVAHVAQQLQLLLHLARNVDAFLLYLLDCVQLALVQPDRGEDGRVAKVQVRVGA